MSVHQAEELAKKYDLISLFGNRFDLIFIKRVTENLQGFKPRESKSESPKDWYKKYESSIPVFKELEELFSELSRDLKVRYSLTKQESILGLIGTFRFLQKREGVDPNLNGFKFGGIQTILRM